LLGSAGSAAPAEPTFPPVSVSGIGCVRTGMRLPASAALMASIRTSTAMPAAKRFTKSGLAIEESTIPPEQPLQRAHHLCAPILIR
jgi:hypothetical protein